MANKLLLLFCFTLLANLLPACTTTYTQLTDQQLSQLVQDLSGGDEKTQKQAAKTLRKAGPEALSALKKGSAKASPGSQERIEKVSKDIQKDIDKRVVALVEKLRKKEKARIGELRRFVFKGKLNLKGLKQQDEFKEIISLGRLAVPGLGRLVRQYADDNAKELSARPRRLSKERKLSPIIDVPLRTAGAVIMIPVGVTFFAVELANPWGIMRTGIRREDRCAITLAAFGTIGNESDIPILLELLRIRPAWNTPLDKVVKLLEAWDREAGLKHLVQALKSDNPAVRANAARMIGQMHGRSATSDLIELLRDEFPEVRRTALGALPLRHIQEESTINEIAKLLYDEDDYVRGTVISALRELRATSALPNLTEILKTETNASNKGNIITTLATLGGKEIVPDIAPFLKDRTPYVRSHAARALGLLGAKTAVAELAQLAKNDDDPSARLVAVNALLAIASEDATLAIEEATPAITDLLKSKEWHIRRRAAEALGKTGAKSAIPHLRDFTKKVNKSYHYDSYIAAQKSLAQLGDESAVVELIGNLGDTDGLWPYARQLAARTLGEIGDKRAIPKLIEAFKTDDTSVAQEAAVALGRIGDASSIAPLKEALTSDHKGVWVHAAAGLSMLGDASGQEILRTTFEDIKTRRKEARKLWWLVAESLANLRDKSVVPTLLPLLEYTERRDINQNAMKLLIKFTDDSFGYDPDSDLESRNAALQKWREWTKRHE